METKTQLKDAGQRLQAAFLKAAMPDPELHIPTLADVHMDVAKNSVKTRVGDGSAGPGRPRNVKNRLTNLRDAVLQAFDQVGGAQYLAKLAQGTSSDRAAFIGLVSKVLPTQINANVEGGIQVQLSWLGSRSIGTTTAQNAETITQVVDLERDSRGKYRMIDPVASSEEGAGGTSQRQAAPQAAQGANGA
tara:strand:+ start:1711 stop:2280 length:570 start_codon:yes stop_codon:yes gene_type:complete